MEPDEDDNNEGEVDESIEGSLGLSVFFKEIPLFTESETPAGLSLVESTMLAVVDSYGK